MKRQAKLDSLRWGEKHIIAQLCAKHTYKEVAQIIAKSPEDGGFNLKVSPATICRFHQDHGFIASAAVHLDQAVKCFDYQDTPDLHERIYRAVQQQIFRELVVYRNHVHEILPHFRVYFRLQKTLNLNLNLNPTHPIPPTTASSHQIAPKTPAISPISPISSTPPSAISMDTSSPGDLSSSPLPPIPASATANPQSPRACAPRARNGKIRGAQPLFNKPTDTVPLRLGWFLGNIALPGCSFPEPERSSIKSCVDHEIPPSFACAPLHLKSVARMTSQQLYEKWLVTTTRFARDQALLDCASERTWTFRDLLTEAERATVSAPILFPQGNCAEFILTLLRAWRAGAPACPLEPNQPRPALPNLPLCAHIKMTSASTGSPKSILFTAEQLAADAANIVSTMGLRPDWPNLGCISLAHSYGFSNLVLPLLLHGIPLILAPIPLPEMVARAAARFPAITLPAVPALWKAWQESNSIPKNTHLAISAGAPLSLSLEAQIFQQRGLKIHNFYGSSECGGIAYDRSAVPRADASLAGSAMDNVRLSISGNKTLIVDSAAVGETYWPDPDVSLRNGRFETSDLTEIRDGEVHLLGRLTDVLNIAGRKASPENIEAALRTHPKVVECAVFGIPDPNHDRTDIIVAVIRATASIPVADLTSFLSSQIPTWQIPRHWWFTGELQPNTRGKISRAEWRQRFLKAAEQQGTSDQSALSSPKEPQI